MILTLATILTLSWPEPTATMKPWVYNWWMGSAVDAAGLEYQCRELADKGFGGFHVIPIYGARGYEKQWKDLLSPEWIEAWNLAAETAAKQGLGIDLTMGSGWCFGGPWIGEEDAASSGMKVKRASPGGTGFMIDPFSAKAMSNHVARFEAAFGKNGTATRPRAFYHDSYEYYGAQPKDGCDPEEAQVACFRVWTDWCRRNGYLSRNEGHGSPVNWLDLYALADIPETEMFGRECRDVLVSKFASSAAHLTGKKLVSAETCTWVDEHFHERPAEIKSVVDRLFLAGVNHCFYHGCCYSPVDAAWPGWCFYASLEMNPRNPIWREIGTLSAYITRCQSVFQTWEPDNDLVVLFDPPYTGKQMSVHNAAEWFHCPGGLGARAKELYEAGYQFDYASPRMLKAQPALKDRMDAAKAVKSPFGGLDGVSSVRLRKDGVRLYFVVSEKHDLHIGAERPFEVMDPMTGEISSLTDYWLEKGASCFVRLDSRPALAVSDRAPSVRLPLAVGASGWTVRPLAGGPVLPPATNLTGLVSWTQWDDAFSGTMLYEATFDCRDEGTAAELDLGDVREIARVRVNGRDLGCRLLAPYRFRIPAGVLKSKDNRLEVEVTNLGANRLRWNDLNHVNWKYFTDINMVDYDYKPLDAAKWQVLPSGLLGPVTLRSDRTGKLVFHLDFNTVQMTHASVSRILREVSALGYDAILWEVEDKVRWESLDVAHPEAFEKDEFREILAEAKALGLEPIPLLQTFGHAEYVLQKPKYAHLRELPEASDCYCVSKPEVRELQKRLIHEYLELFGKDVKWFHLGGDEARSFGKCPECSKRRPMELYAEHLQDVSAELKSSGIRPGIWCDMMLGKDYVADVGLVSKDFMIWHWDYRVGTGEWLPLWSERMSLLIECGYDVVFAGASQCGGDSPFFPDLSVHRRNLSYAAEAVRQHNLMALCVTSWSIRQGLKELQYPLLRFAAKRLRNPSADVSADWTSALSDSGVSLSAEEADALTAWSPLLCCYDGRGGWRDYKDAQVPPPGTLERSIAKCGPPSVLVVSNLLAGVRCSLPRAEGAWRDAGVLECELLEDLAAVAEGRKPQARPPDWALGHLLREQAPGAAANSARLVRLQP